MDLKAGRMWRTLYKSTIFLGISILCFSTRNYGRPYNYSSKKTTTYSAPINDNCFGTKRFEIGGQSTEHFQSFDTQKKNRLLKIAAAPAGLSLLGVMSWNSRKHYRGLRNRYMPHFESKIDDYIQYSPALAVYALNLAGVKGKHNLNYSTTALGLACLLNTTITTTMKNSFGEVRPDGSAKNSFPSGHTATAFMCATMLHKEYGDQSSLYSYFGYAAATSVGVMRVLNNRHWVSDVLVGAGIGILSTELAYVLSDMIFQDKGLNQLPTRSYAERLNRKPSFITIKTGGAYAAGGFAINGEQIDASSGFSSSVEGAYFFNRWLGMGAQLSISSMNVDATNYYTKTYSNNKLSSIDTQAFGSTYFLVGPYFNCALPRHWDIVFNANIGQSIGASGSVSAVVDADVIDPKQEAVVISEFAPESSVAFGAGVNIRKMINRQIAVGAYANYYYNNPNMKFTDYIDSETINNSYKVDQSLFNFGVSVSACF